MIQRRSAFTGRRVGVRPGTMTVQLGDPDASAYEEQPCPPDMAHNYMTPPFDAPARAVSSTTVIDVDDDGQVAPGTAYSPYANLTRLEGLGRTRPMRDVALAGLGGPWGAPWGTVLGILFAGFAGGVALEAIRQGRRRA
jgi:hypothetical protein